MTAAPSRRGVWKVRRTEVMKRGVGEDDIRRSSHLERQSRGV